MMKFTRLGFILMNGRWLTLIPETRNSRYEVLDATYGENRMGDVLRIIVPSFLVVPAAIYLWIRAAIIQWKTSFSALLFMLDHPFKGWHYGGR